VFGRVVEIAEDGRHLSLHRGFMVVSADKAEIGRVPLDDIGVVVANAHGLTYTNNLLIELAGRGVSVVLCGPHHRPVAWLWPIEGHHTQALRMRAQLSAPAPLGKRLWQVLVRAKIQQQGAALAALGRPSGGFQLLARQVRSGDPENIEAQAARRYWPLMLGESFRRDSDGRDGANAMLNYGYAILRAATARATVAAGLHPSIGIHHRNQYNALCLVDDLMEPFRPLVDGAVARLVAAGAERVDRETKKQLAGVVALDMRTNEGTTPVATCLMRLAVSLAQAFESGEANLDLPIAPLPLELPALPAKTKPAAAG
jgi:CRISPR-associated protein Cas1